MANEFKRVTDVYNEYLLIEDPHLLYIVFGSILANRLDNAKTWVFLMGPSSSGKSEILMSVSGSEDVYPLDSLTEHSLVSHYKGTTDTSLLPRLNRKTMVIKDASVITSMNPNIREGVFNQLRAIYDGSFDAVSGMGEKRLKSSFGIIAGCTPAFEKLRTLESALGERFFYFRLRLKDYKGAMKKSEKHIAHQSEVQKILKRSASNFLDNFGMDMRGKKPVNIWGKIEEYCSFLVKLRCSSSRDSFSKDIDYPMVTSEAPIRVSKILIGLYTGIRALDIPVQEAVGCIKRVIFDSCPMTRTIVLESILNGNTQIREICRDVKMSNSPVNRVIEELEHIGIIDKGSELKIKDEYEETFRELSMGLSFRDFLIR